MAVAIIDQKAHPSAAPWYKSAPIEPIGNKSTIKVDTVVEIDTLTLEKIFDKILELKGVNEVLIVAHGDADGLAIPLMLGSAGGANNTSIFAIAQDRETTEADETGQSVRLPPMSVKRAAEITTLSEANTTSLRAKMNRVRALKLKHVALRACNTGSNRDTMRTFRKLFGADSISAPDVFDSYGHTAAGVHTKLPDWVAAQKKAGFSVAVEGKVAFGIKHHKGIWFQIALAGESQDAIKAWVKQHIRDDYSMGEVIYHGMTISDQTGAHVAFVRDPEFTDHLVFVAK